MSGTSLRKERFSFTPCSSPLCFLHCCGPVYTPPPHSPPSVCRTKTVFQYRCCIDGIRPGTVSPRKHLVMFAHFPSCPSTPGDRVLRCLTGERAGTVGDLLPCPRPPPRPPPPPASSAPEISRVRERNPALHHVLSHPVTLSLPGVCCIIEK